MLYIYRRRNSTGARDLAEGIMIGAEGVRGIPARRTKGQMLQRLTNQDQVICWGDFFAAPQGVRTLNNVEPLSKFAEAQLLATKGVATVTVSRTKPRTANAERPAFVPQTFQGRQFNMAAVNGYNEAQVSNLVTEINEWLGEERNRRTAFLTAEQTRRQQWAAQPVAPAETWLGRSNRHVGGNDLLNTPETVDYYSKKENIVEEYRIHMFKGRSIRAGKKVQQPARPDGSAPHAWIRSYDAGWVIRYDGFQSTKAMRKLAKAALDALGLDFGAVDMAKKADGTLMVLEVNRAPGVEGGTVEAYAKHVINWVRNPADYNKDEE